MSNPDVLSPDPSGGFPIGLKRLHELPLLASHARACLFLDAGQANPRAWPFIVKELDNELWFQTYAKSAKMSTVIRSNHASCLVFPDEENLFPYLVVDGSIEVVGPTRELVSRWFEKPEIELQEIPAAVRLLTGKRVFIVLHPYRILMFPSGASADG